MMVATSVSVLSIWVRFQVNVCFIPKLFECSETVSIKKKIIIYYLSYIAYVFICIVKKNSTIGVINLSINYLLGIVIYLIKILKSLLITKYRQSLNVIHKFQDFISESY